MLELTRALRLGATPCLAFVGAGGKTTLMFHLARELADRGTPVLVSTSTHLAASQAQLADRHWIVQTSQDIPELDPLPVKVTLLSGPAGSDERLKGLDFATLRSLAQTARQQKAALLIEADGARLRPLKAPAEYEPAIPEFVDTVVVVTGLAGLGMPLSEENVHRPERFADLSGLAMGEAVTPQALTRVLVHPQGGLKGIPPGARRVVLLNQSDTPALQSQAAGLSQRLLGAYDAVGITSFYADKGMGVKDTQPSADPIPVRYSPVFLMHEKIAGIVLAAGKSSRFGEPKVLLEWRKKPLVWHVAQTALQGGLDPVVAVAGAEIDAVREILAGLPVTVVHNLHWEAGQSTSLRAGLEQVPAVCGGAIFLLADQPQTPTSLVHALVGAHASTLAPIVAPQILGQRGNPVLFDRDTFPELMTLQGDVGGRPLFAKYPVEWLPWVDPNQLLDVDKPEDYAQLMGLE